MINLVYFSNVSENTERFIKFLKTYMKTVNNTSDELKTFRIPVSTNEIDTFTIPEEDYILIVPSYGTERNGHVPHQVKKFLKSEDNRKTCIGVIGTGNMNFGKEYAVSADVISKKLHVPILHKFELSGMDKDYRTVSKIVHLDKQTINEIAEKHSKGNKK